MPDSLSLTTTIRTALSAYRFEVGALLVHDEVYGAIVIDRRRLHAVPVYDLRLSNGYFVPSIVEGYLKPWPSNVPRPKFRPIVSYMPTGRAWCEAD